MGKKVSLSLDIGGTWIKGTTIECELLDHVLKGISSMPVNSRNIKRVKSNLSQNASTGMLIEALKQLFSSLLTPDMELCGVGISTAGVVDYAGKEILFTATHLSPLKDNSWVHWISRYLDTPVVLINDADAVTVGAAALGYLKGYRTIGVMPVGTGLGFTVWRNGRRWNPHFCYTLLGCVSTPDGSFDELASVVSFTDKHPDHDLLALFDKKEYHATVNTYLDQLVSIIHTSYYIYHTDEILIGGGLADAVREAGFQLEERMNEKLAARPLLDGKIQTVRLLHEGNLLPLLGAALVGYGENAAKKMQQKKAYRSFETEKAYNKLLKLEEMGIPALVNLLWNAEQEAGSTLNHSLEDISEVAGKMVQSLQAGGRLIYVGAGTSGRLAAIDTVELACTFGVPRDRVLTLIAGSVADAAFDIEMQFEEDASSVPDMLMAAVCRNDIVIGISVSGSAYYVQSALAYAKQVGAYSVMIQEGERHYTFCDKNIALRSGHEIIAGSTRMKAGTATKKVLNFLSTATMIRLGKVHGCFMTNVECINEKLILRALHILKSLFGLSDEEALKLLEERQNNLNEAINHYIKSKNLPLTT